MGRQTSPGFGSTLQAAQHLLRNTRLMEQSDQTFPAGRRLVRGLEDHRIAGEQRRHDVAVRQMRREIERAEHGEDAMRLVAQCQARAHFAFEAALGAALGIGTDRNIDLPDHGVDFGGCLPERLAGLAGD